MRSYDLKEKSKVEVISLASDGHCSLGKLGFSCCGSQCLFSGILDASKQWW